MPEQESPIQFIPRRGLIFTQALLALDERVKSSQARRRKRAVEVRVLAFGGLSELPDYKRKRDLERDPKVRWVRKLQHLTKPLDDSAPPVQLMAIYDLPLTRKRWEIAKTVLYPFEGSTAARIKVLPAFKVKGLRSDALPLREMFTRVAALSCCIFDYDASLVGLPFGEWIVRTQAALAISNAKFSSRLRTWFDDFPWAAALTLYDPEERPNMTVNFRTIEDEYGFLFRP